MQSSESLTALATALAKAQAEMKNPTFDSVNPHFKSKFASLAAVRESVIPVLAKHGLSLTQFPTTMDGMAGCVNRLLHASGEWLEHSCLLPLDRNNAQGAGSCITYARRYSLQGIAGVVADEDDDGNAAVDEKPRKAHKPSDGAQDRVEGKRQSMIADIATEVKDYLAQGKDWDAYCMIETELSDPDERVYLWTFLDAPGRRRIKEQAEQAKKKAGAA
jgi:hypothetical protein